MSEPDAEDQADEQPSKTVRVPIRGADGPFGSEEFAEVPEVTADHWSERIWHAVRP